MGRHLRFIVLILCSVLLAPVPWALAEPVNNVANHPIISLSKKLTADDIRKNIIIAGLKRHWHFEEVAPGQLKGTQGSGKRQATISLTFTDAAYSITLLESVGLDQKGDQVARRYNGWVRYLLQDIDDQLSKAALGA